MAPIPKKQPEHSINLAVALEYIAAGIKVFPCRAEAEEGHDGKMYLPKSPIPPDGLYGATTNERIVRELWKRNPAALVGIPTGSASGFFALDVDVSNGKSGDESLAALQADNGPLSTVVVRTATGGRHFLFKHEEGLTNSTGALPDFLDCRAEGGYVIAAGSTFPDGTFYEFEGGHSPRDFLAFVAPAPSWLVGTIKHRARSAAPYEPANDNTPVGASEVEEMLSYISPDCGYEEWVGVLMAVHGALGADGLAIADAWSRGGSKYKAGDVVTRWRGFKEGKGVGTGTLAKLARDGGADLSEIARRHRGSSTSTTDTAIVGEFLAKQKAKREGVAASAPVAVPAVANDNQPNATSLNIYDWTVDRFIGEPPRVEYLVEGVIPLGVPGMVSAMGDTGKSFALLELHRRVAFGQGTFAPDVFGGKVAACGTSVMITSEDDAGEVHRRMAALDQKSERFGPDGKKMIVVPLPSAGGAMAFWRDDKKNGLLETDDFKRISDQLRNIKDLKLVTFDPLASFAHLPLNEDPAAGQFVCTSLSRLATETGATVLVAHHMRKTQKPIENLGDARDAIRGSTALVDGLRLAYAMWPADEARGKRVCKALGEEYVANRVVLGGVVKANGPAKRIVSTLVRNPHGLLIDRTAALGANAPDQSDLRAALVIAVEAAAASGQPFTKTGSTGLYAMRERLPSDLRGLSRHRIEGIATAAIEGGDIQLCLASGTTAKWLDVPGGHFAIGLGEFRKGAAR